MRISLLALHYAEYAMRLGMALARHHEVQLILNEANLRSELEGESDHLLSMPGLRSVLLPHRRSAGVLLGNARRILREVASFRPDVLHAQEVTKDYAMPAMLWLPRRFPTVLTVHDPHPHSGQEALDFQFSRKRFYQYLARNTCDRAVVHGLSLQTALAEHSPRLAGRIDVISHGVLGPLSPLEPAPEPGTLLFFGRIHAYKGLRHFVEATLLLRQRGHKIRAIIAGQGPDLAPNRALIDANDCFELRDAFISRVEVHELFRRAGLIVMPYTDGTQSGVAAMALGFGRPVVATQVGSIPEMIADGETGKLVEPNNPVALADAIEAILTSPEHYTQLCKHATTAAYGELGWDAIARRSVACYESAIAQRQGTTTREIA